MRLPAGPDGPYVMNVVGARPQFIKAGPVSRELHRREIPELLVHTGQHYDPLLSDAIFVDVGLRPADVNLDVGSGSHAEQTATMLVRLEQIMLERRPRVVVTYGDTNSTVAAALAASKLHLPLAHVEAGLRSFNRRMPEEVNRIATDHLSDVLLAPTETAMRHLADEGLADRSVFTGDVMLDALRSISLEDVTLPSWAAGTFAVATIHRAENTDDARVLRSILDAVSRLQLPVHLLAHPRLRARASDLGMAEYLDRDSLRLHDPLPYATMLAAVKRATLVLTDSGGLQKEAFLLRTPCLTLRRETEWPETLTGGWNRLALDELDHLAHLVSERPDPVDVDPFGDGEASVRIVDRLVEMP